jgi:hypothetical protein
MTTDALLRTRARRVAPSRDLLEESRYVNVAGSDRSANRKRATSMICGRTAQRWNRLTEARKEGPQL